MTHECIQEENIGKIKEFIANTKGSRTLLSGIVIAIVLQVGTFLFLWGSLTTTVNYHDKTIDKLCKKLDNVKIVGYAYANDKDDMK